MSEEKIVNMKNESVKGQLDSSKRPLIPPDAIIKDYIDSVSKFFNSDESILDKHVEKLSTMPSYKMYDLEIWAAFVYFDITASPDDGNGPVFKGKAGGLAGLVGGKAWGTLYTDDIQNLADNTKSFMFTCYGGVYEALYFYDSNSNLLGYIQAGGFTIAAGMAGGTGSWSW